MKMRNGLHIEWSNVNLAWFLMWHAEVLRIFNCKMDAEHELERLLN